MPPSADLEGRRLPAVDQLLRHCLALGKPRPPQPPARRRLEDELGPELAQRLLETLTVGSRG